MEQTTMTSITKKQRIASLILQESTIGLSRAEQEELNSWRQSDSCNETTYAALHRKDYSSDLARYREIDTQEELKNYRRRYVKHTHRFLSGWYRAAAIAVLAIGISIFFFQREQNHITPQITIRPGSSKAMLVLNNGDIIPLSKTDKAEIIATEELSIQNDGSQLCYTVSENVKNKPVTNYNELIVPKGGEFTLTLSDGTKVWLNSQSKIKYPVIFNGMTREVYLEGEAYFEVVKDSLHPFYVNAGNGVNVEVLGTSFNVRNYADENSVVTVLEEGSVRMSHGKDTVVLRPGNKAVCLPNEQIRLTTVNTELYTAWRCGQYIFMNESVENILKQLARWYDIEVFYNNESAKSVVFSGDVRKYENIDTFLEAMEVLGGVHFNVNGQTLIVNYNH